MLNCWLSQLQVGTYRSVLFLRNVKCKPIMFNMNIQVFYGKHFTFFKGVRVIVRIPVNAPLDLRSKRTLQIS